MKVLIAAPTYLPSRRANTLQVMKMAQALHGLGYEICVLVPDQGAESEYPRDEIKQLYGLQSDLNIVWLPVNPYLRGYDYSIKIVRYFRRWGGDVLYTRLPQAAAFGSALKLPTVFEIHDLPGGFMGSWLFRRFLQGSGSRRLVVITQALKADVEKQFGKLLQSPFAVVAPDGVDLVRYENIPAPEEARRSLRESQGVLIPEEKFTLGYSGHFYPGRGMDQILAVASKSPEFTFLLIGGNHQDIDVIRSEVSVRALDNIIITGFIPNLNLPLYQAACNVLLMPYQEVVEASSGGDIAKYLSPMKMFEYLACGRVVIASDLPVLREVLNDQNSILLHSNDVDAWVEAISDISTDSLRQKSLSERSKNDAMKYSWESRVEQILSGEWLA
jgi:glycosyltransferase involved in cell wall biosynthesis